MSDGSPWITATIGGTIKEPGQEHLPKRIPSLPLFFCAGSPCVFQHPLASPRSPSSLIVWSSPPSPDRKLWKLPHKTVPFSSIPIICLSKCRPLFTRSGGQVVLGTGGGRWWWWVGLFKETLWRKWVWQEKNWQQWDDKYCGCTHTSHMQVLCVHRAAHLSELLSVDFIIPPHFLSCVEHSVVIPIIPFPRAFSHPRPSLWDSSAVYALSFSDGDLNRLNWLSLTQCSYSRASFTKPRHYSLGSVKGYLIETYRLLFKTVLSFSVPFHLHEPL